MFMSYLLTGFVLLALTLVFLEPREKNKKKMGKKEKTIRIVLSYMVHIINIVLVIMEPRLHFVMALFFIAIFIAPPRKKGRGSTTDYDFDN